MKLAQGDIVLVPVPFTDLSSQKRRPVIVVSNNSYHQSTADFVAIALTSQPTTSQFGFTIVATDLSEGMLKRPSQVRSDKIYTLAQSIVVNRFGQVHTTVLDKIRMLLNSLTATSP